MTKKVLWNAIGWGMGVVVIGAVVALSIAGAHDKSDKPEAGGDAPDAYQVHADTISADQHALLTAGIELLTVEPKEVPTTLTLTGRTGLDMENVSHVHAQFGGKVTQVGPQLGDTVKGPAEKGGPTVLCVIESNDLAQAKSNYLQAKIQLKLDQDNLVRTRELVKSTVLADKFLIDAESAVVKDRALFEAARQSLLVFGLTQSEIDNIESQVGRQRMDYVITAPRWGVVAEKGVSGGEVADPTMNLFTIADTSTMWVWGDVYERDLRRIKVGQAVKILFTSEPDRVRTCRIDWISPVLDPNSHSIRVRGSLDNKDGHLLADMYGTMIVTVSQGKESLVVPAECIVRQGTNAFAFVVVSRDSRTTFRRTPVKIEPVDVGFGVSDSAAAAVTADSANSRTGEEALARPLRIMEGLKKGDQIVQRGALGLFNEMEQQSHK